jgi:WD40 repeat protein
VVSWREFRGVDLLGLTFTPDGKRFAVAAGSAVYVDRNLNSYDANLPTRIRVHDTTTGKTLAAFAPATRRVLMRFSPDGQKLVVVNEDRTIELWDVSGPDRALPGIR